MKATYALHVEPENLIGVQWATRFGQARELAVGDRLDELFGAFCVLAHDERQMMSRKTAVELFVVCKREEI